jgi:glycosyltransferase involved in cell wall biosynthesis
MKIAINCQLLLENELRGMGTYKFELLKHLIPLDNKNVFYLLTYSRNSYEFVLKAFKENHNCIVVLKEVPIVIFEQLFVPYFCIINAIDFIVNSGDTASILAVLTKTKSILVLHDAYFCKKSVGPIPVRKWFAKTYRRICVGLTVNRSFMIFTVSEFAKRDIEYEFGSHLKNKIVIGYNGLGCKPSEGEELTKENSLLMVTGADPQKNVRWFLEGLVKNKTFLNGLNCVDVVGINSFTDIGFNDHPKINYHGFLSKIDLDVQYRKAKYFAIPSLMESFGIPAIEALSYGCCVLSSNTGALQEVLGDHAIYFSPNSHAELNNSIEDLLECWSPDKVLTVMKTELQRYSWESTAEKFALVFDRGAV